MPYPDKLWQAEWAATQSRAYARPRTNVTAIGFTEGQPRGADAGAAKSAPVHGQTNPGVATAPLSSADLVGTLGVLCIECANRHGGLRSTLLAVLLTFHRPSRRRRWWVNFPLPEGALHPTKIMAARTDHRGPVQQFGQAIQRLREEAAGQTTAPTRRASSRRCAISRRSQKTEANEAQE
jgi:hypothetical protein